MVSEDLDATVDSEPGSATSPPKEKKVGFLKAKLNNFINSSISASKPRTRQIQNIVDIVHLLEERPDIANVKQKPTLSAKFYIQYKLEVESPEKQRRQ
jgi:hypothetical protein